MKKGRPVVVAPQPHPEVLHVLHECAQALACPLVGTEGHVRSCGPPHLADGACHQSLDILDPATGSPALPGLLPSLTLCHSCCDTLHGYVCCNTNNASCHFIFFK